MSPIVKVVPDGITFFTLFRKDAEIMICGILDRYDAADGMIRSDEVSTSYQ